MKNYPESTRAIVAAALAFAEQQRAAGMTPQEAAEKLRLMFESEGEQMSGQWQIKYNLAAEPCVVSDQGELIAVCAHEGIVAREAEAAANARLFVHARELHRMVQKMIPALLGRPVEGNAFDLVSEARVLLCNINGTDVPTD